VRLFVAVNFDDEVRGDLTAVVDELRRRSSKGTFTRPGNLHLTLVFLGECDQRQMEAARAAMDAVAFEPFRLCVEGFGSFKRRDGDVWWAGVARNESLSRLQADLIVQLRDVGFDLEGRKYKPHVTLGRRIVLDTSTGQGGLLGVSVSQPVHHIELMQSERIGGKLVYTPLYSVHSADGTRA